MKQTILLMTFFYDPAVAAPPTFSTEEQPLTEAALLDAVRACLAQGGMVCTSRTEAAVFSLIPDSSGPGLGHDWVALSFLPLAKATAPGEPFVLLDMEDPLYAH